MLPQRAKTYCWLFMAMSASVCANILLFQQRQGAGVPGDPRALRMTAGIDAASGAVQASDTVRAIQRELKDLTLYPGQPDGKVSPMVTAAIVAYEQAQALPITGEPTQALLREMIVGPSGDLGKPGAVSTGVAPGSAADKLIRDIRMRLAAIGYAVGNGDGRMTLELIQGIRAFERDNNLSQTGRISAHLVMQLQRSAAGFKSRPG
jgi:peptidoglycan hydrolase-like protein with peptidoglycan-binding domain